MSSRGLPGFLRRSRRWNDFEDEDDEVDEAGDEEEEENKVNDNSGRNKGGQHDHVEEDQKKKQKQQQDVMESTFTASLRFLDPSPLAVSSAKEDADVGYATNESRNKNGDKANQHNRDGDDDDDDDEGYHSGNHSVSTLGDNDPPTPRNTPFGGSRSSSSASNSSNKKGSGAGGPTYRELQFEKILSNNVVKLTELRQVGWNGIPVRHYVLALFTSTVWYYCY
jgi:hypothetical protein